MCNSVDYFGIMYSEVIFILVVVVCMCERLTPDTLSTQTEAQDDAHRRAPILRHKASKSNWIVTIFLLLPTKHTSVDYETHRNWLIFDNTYNHPVARASQMLGEEHFATTWVWAGYI